MPAITMALMMLIGPTRAGRAPLSAPDLPDNVRANLSRIALSSGQAECVSLDL